ncbi:MAG: hypothetical protein BWY22_00266 [Bacteroidetes bacterium ADurb.Bin217]|nr:MAG: hypothetical protein BWY22_00266 [Bacteroidetes bacterium ADurb.Bin217]
MPTLKPFKAFRPKADVAQQIASRPYDVLNSDEAKQEAGTNDLSFYHVIKPEIDLPAHIDVHSQPVYDKAKENLQHLIVSGVLLQDAKPCYYIYAQTMNGKTQYGIVGGASVEDYENNIIKKHELTRPDKEEDRMNHVRYTNFNAEPVFFAFKNHVEIDMIIHDAILLDPIYNFVSQDGVGHHVWIIENDAKIKRIEYLFKHEIDYLYVADGHHRTAAAALVGAERRKNNPNHTGNEEYNFFLSVNFPANQLTIIDYNRVVTDLNGLSVDEFIAKLQTSFDVEHKGTQIYKPTVLHNFALYVEGNWYSLTAKTGTFNDADPIGVLDVTILTEQILSPILNIEDLRRSTRIDFVGGIRGLGELQKRVDSGEMKAAFALFPVSMEQLMAIADNDCIMPPKTTWFEPKLRSGLLLHSLE